ncbi:MAG TPA: hypothetical protein VKI40_05865, partial [Terriglobales bacterium]|nr:hypothetical protein [Terriglobales bacterium]
RPQMNVKNMEGGRHPLNIRVQAAALLTPLFSYVVVLDGTQWKPTEQQVAVCPAVESAVFTKAEIEAKFCGNKVRLIFLALSVNAQNFLKRDDIRINLMQHFHDASWVHPPVESAALVNVICQNPKTGRHASKLVLLNNWMLFGIPWVQLPIDSRPFRSLCNVKG